MTIVGIRILVWDWKERKTETHGKVDKSLNYVFALSTPGGSTEVVTDYAQIEKASYIALGNILREIVLDIKKPQMYWK